MNHALGSAPATTPVQAISQAPYMLIAWQCEQEYLAQRIGSSHSRFSD